MMKAFFIFKLRKILKILAVATINKYQPGVIGITGSVGKTSTKLAVAAVLEGVRKFRVSRENFNNEIGIPLTILGDWRKIEGLFFWPKVVIKSVLQLLFRFEYPEILILEYAVDHPGDMKYLLGIARPQIAIFTAMGEVPVHVEFFQNPEAIVREKSRLLEVLPANGFCILNADDPRVFGLRDKVAAHILSFGFENQAEVCITNFEYRYVGLRPAGVFFKINYGGTFVPIKIDGIFSKAQVYSAGAAAALGLAFGLNLVRIAENLQKFKAGNGRMQIIPGLRGLYILDDSYNAAPASMWSALDTLKSLKGKRRVAILGDMLEIGQYSLEVHESIGEYVAKFVDLLVTVGPRAKFIASASIKKGLSVKKIYSFDRVEESLETIVDSVQEHDLVLIKGSHGIHLDKVVQRLSRVVI